MFICNMVHFLDVSVIIHLLLQYPPKSACFALLIEKHRKFPHQKLKWGGGKVEPHLEIKAKE